MLALLKQRVQVADHLLGAPAPQPRAMASVRADFLLYFCRHTSPVSYAEPKGKSLSQHTGTADDSIKHLALYGGKQSEAHAPSAPARWGWGGIQLGGNLS